MTLTKRKVEALLKRNEIDDFVLTDWNRKQNKNCKFLPGETVAVKTKQRSNQVSKIAKTFKGYAGKVIAASTVDGERMNSENYRTTFYYVNIGEAVIKYPSNSLRAHSWR